MHRRLQLRQRGFVRVRVDGEILDLSQDIALDKNKKHNIEVYVDRLVIKGDRGSWFHAMQSCPMG